MRKKFLGKREIFFSFKGKETTVFFFLFCLNILKIHWNIILLRKFKKMA